MGGVRSLSLVGGARAWPDFAAKVEMLKLMDNKVIHETSALSGTRCFVEAETLPKEMAAELTKKHEKTRLVPDRPA